MVLLHARRARRSAVPARSSAQDPSDPVSSSHPELSALPDSIWLQRLEQGDSSALVPLFDRYAVLVFSLLTRIVGEPATAEQLLQEVFLTLPGEAARLGRHPESLLGWLLLHSRAAAVACLAGEDAPCSPRSDCSPCIDRACSHEELGKRSRAILGRLPRAERDVLELSFFAGLSTREIADRLGIPSGKVRDSLLTAVRLLRQTDL